jgi:quercetin dioxygenase-like cupin family protein
MMIWLVVAALPPLAALSSTAALAAGDPTSARDAATATDVATDLSKAEIELLGKLPGTDHTGKVIDIGKLNVSIAVVHRGVTHDKPGDPITGITHDHTAEVYYILSGTGLLTTGGTTIDPMREAADSDIVRYLNGPSISGTNQGGRTRKVGPGDVIVIPPGVFHGFSQITEDMIYLSVRPDPDRVLPAGYVNPALKKK